MEKNELTTNVMRALGNQKRNRKIEELTTLWNHLDDAQGSYYNAMENALAIDDIPEDVLNSIQQVDVTALSTAKHEISELMENRYGSLPWEKEEK